MTNGLHVTGTWFLCYSQWSSDPGLGRLDRSWKFTESEPNKETSSANILSLSLADAIEADEKKAAQVSQTSFYDFLSVYTTNLSHIYHLYYNFLAIDGGKT